jgi:hypothetical protein
MIFGTSNIERMRITAGGTIKMTDENGGVPILQVRNFSTAATGAFTNGYAMEFRGATTTGAGNGMMLLHNNEANDTRPTLHVSDSNGVFATFTNGRVGIGMAPSTDAKLEVLNGNIRLRGSSANSIMLSTTGGATRAALGNAGNEGDLSLWRSNNIKTVFISSYYDGYINNTTKKFGFGTTTPTTKLDVHGTTGTRNRNTTSGETSSVFETSRYYGVAGNATTNVSIDTSVAFPPMASGGYILVEVSAAGYGSGGTNGLIFSYITGGYGGHYAALNAAYHPVTIIVNTMQNGTCTWYNPDVATIGITIANGSSTGVTGVMRVKVTTTY